MKSLELKIPPLIITLIFAALIWVIPDPYKLRNNSIFIILSSFLFLIGSLISILGVLEFRKMKTTVNPMSPERSNNLVVRSIYKYTRNPMYLGFLLWLFSLGTLLRSPISILFIVVFIIYMNLFQIMPEENILEEKFGKEYLEYRKRVRRWF